VNALQEVFIGYI